MTRPDLAPQAARGRGRGRAGALTTIGALAKAESLYLSHTQINDAGCFTLATEIANDALALNELKLHMTPASAVAKAYVYGVDTVMSSCGGSSPGIYPLSIEQKWSQGGQGHTRASTT